MEVACKKITLPKSINLFWLAVTNLCVMSSKCTAPIKSEKKKKLHINIPSIASVFICFLDQVIVQMINARLTCGSCQIDS